MQIPYAISDEKVNDFSTHFLKARPIPVDEEDKPIMTVKQWIHYCGKEFFMSVYRDGKQIAAREQTVVDEEIIN